MQVKGQCDFHITTDHVEQFVEQCDCFALYWIIRKLSTDKSRLDQLREFFADRPQALAVVDALQGVGDAVAAMKTAEPQGPTP